MSDQQDSGAGENPKRKRPARAPSKPRKPRAKAKPDIESPPPEPTEQSMDIHKPKPVHSWRELGTEVGVIVIGILIALGLEQAVESWHADEKATIAQESLDAEMRQNVRYAIFWSGMLDCAERQSAALSQAIGEDDQAKLREMLAVSSMPQPFGWSDSAWQSVLASDVSDRFDEEKRFSYSGAYYLVNRIRGYQERYVDAWARLNALAKNAASKSPTIAGAELSELAEMSAAFGGIRNIARIMSPGSKSQLVTNLELEIDRPASNEGSDFPRQCKAAADRLETLAGES